MTGSARLGRAGGVLLAGLVTIAVAAPLVAPDAASGPSALPLQPPSAAHLLGTDDIGQDLLSQVLVGTRISLLVGVVGALLATGIGTLVGLTAGLVGGIPGAVLMRLTDVVLTLPTLPLMIVLHVYLGAGLQAEILVIGGLMWARTARVLRSHALASLERGSVDAARVMGAGPVHLLVRHLLPAALPLFVPELVRAINVAILFETSLSFLGFGDPTARSWGTILYYANARNAYLTDAWPWWVVPPGLLVAVTVLSFALIGYAIEESSRPVLVNVRRRRSSGQPAEVAPALEPGGPVVDARDLSIAYPAGDGLRTIVHQVSFTIGASEILGVVGESGSGKTTVASALLQLSRPPGVITGGRLLVGGRDVARLSERELQALRGAVVSLVPQNAMNALNPVQRVGDQLIEALRAHAPMDRGTAGERVAAALAAVGIPPDRATAYPHELSGGMRQRVVLAMALLHGPRLVIADEPTTGLDLLRQAEVLRLVRDLRDRFHTAVLFVSHDLAAVASLADRVLVMQAGRIVEAGDVRRVLSDPQHPCTRRLVAAIPRLDDAAAARETGGRGESPVLEVRDVHKVFPARRGAPAVVAADGVTFAVHAGERVGLVGPSGAGKSTIARLVVGLERADRGRVRLDDRPVHSHRRADRRSRGRRVHLILQDAYDALPPGRRVREIVAEPLRIHGPAGLLSVEEAIDAAGLADAHVLDRFPHQLSGGERQRVALARALVLQPRLIVADEPTSLLDPSRRAGLLDVMRASARQQGTAYLYITHDLALARSFCDRLLIIELGRIVEEGPAADVIAQPRHPCTQALVRAAHVLSDVVRRADA